MTEPISAVKPGERTVLLVDDEPTVRKVLKRILEHAGFQVLMASNADDALELAAQHPEMIDVLVTDVVMPATDGPTLARILCERHPSLRVLFVSGYPDSGSPNSFGDSGVPSAEFLHKPFSPTALADKIRSVLNED